MTQQYSSSILLPRETVDIPGGYHVTVTAPPSVHGALREGRGIEILYMPKISYKKLVQKGGGVEFAPIYSRGVWVQQKKRSNRVQSLQPDQRGPAPWLPLLGPPPMAKWAPPMQRRPPNGCCHAPPTNSAATGGLAAAAVKSHGYFPPPAGASIDRGAAAERRPTVTALRTRMR